MTATLWHRRLLSRSTQAYASWVRGVLVVVLLGCGGTSVVPDAGDAPTDATDAKVILDASQDTQPDGGTVMFIGTIVRCGSATPLATAKVCVFKTMSCALTDAGGQVSLAMPAHSETGVTIERAGYTNVLIPLATTDQDETYTACTRDVNETTSDYAVMGATYPDVATSFLQMVVSPPNMELGKTGVSFVMTPTADKGPTYYDAMGTPNTNLAATTTYSIAAATFKSSVMETSITYNPPQLSCSPNFGGWSSMVVNTVRVPLLPGFETHVGQRCL